MQYMQSFSKFQNCAYHTLIGRRLHRFGFLGGRKSMNLQNDMQYLSLSIQVLATFNKISACLMCDFTHQTNCFLFILCAYQSTHTRTLNTKIEPKVNGKTQL